MVVWVAVKWDVVRERGSAVTSIRRAGRELAGEHKFEVVPGDDPNGPADANGAPSMRQVTAAGLDVFRRDPRLAVTDEAVLRAQLAAIESRLAEATQVSP